MFDARVVCLIRFQRSAFASAEALRELKELISRPGRPSGDGVVKVQLQSLSRKGGSDAPRHEVISSKSIAAVAPAGRNAALGKPTGKSAPGGALLLLVQWLRSHSRGDAQYVNEEVCDE